MIKALIFDFNGVIVDDEPIHMRMFQEALRDEGIPMSDKDYYRFYLGMNDKDCFTSVLKQEGLFSDRMLRKMMRRKKGLYRAYIAKHLIFFPGARALIRRVARKYPLAIASGALRSEIRYILGRGGLRKCFSVIVAAEDVRIGKPNPECFRLALKRLNTKLRSSLKPRECLVLEDSLEGISAAKKAGMQCLALATSHPAKKLKQADTIVKGYSEIKLREMVLSF